MSQKMFEPFAAQGEAVVEEALAPLQPSEMKTEATEECSEAATQVDSAPRPVFRRNYPTLGYE